MSEMSKSKKTLYTMVLTAVFAALSFAATYIYIPVGISKVHLGNFVCIIAGLLCGGLVGGLSGAIGMGLNDLAMGYGPDTIIRTVLVKFLMGFIAGYLFRLFVKKQKKVDWIYITLAALFLAIFVTFLTLYIIYGGEIIVGNYKMKNSIFLVIVTGLISIFFITILILARYTKLIKPIQKYILITTAISSTLNIIFEFILKIPFKMAFAGMNFTQAFYYDITSIPGSVLTTILTIVIVTIIYLPVYYATHKFNKLDNMYSSIQKITTFSEDNKENN